MDEIILELKNVTKEFPGVIALNDVSLSIKRGEIHALCGENGAGKSTLINLLSGVYPYTSYRGDIYMNGDVVRFKSVRDSEMAGITCIHQELALAPDMTVADNVFLGRMPAKFGVVQKMKMVDRCKELLQMVGLVSEDKRVYVHPDDIVANLGVGQQQLIEIARALSRKSNVLILDEPTSALTEQETEILFNVLRQLRKNGVTCIYISHKLSEVMEISDSISILRDGKYIDSRSKDELSKDELIRLMVGRTLSNLYSREEHTRQELIFEIRDYTLYDKYVRNKVIVNNVNLKAYKGEILGITGLMGSGRTELFSSVFGGYKGKSEGKVFLGGREYRFKSPDEAIKLGYYYLPEDRKSHGVFLDLQVKENTTISSLDKVSKFGVISMGEEIEQSRKLNESLKTKTQSMETLIRTLSGGNQQKVIIARSLMSDPVVLVMDEPTRGIDIGAKFEIYKIMNQLVDTGVTIILISSEMEEVIGIADRIVVFNRGEVKGELTYGDFSQERILALGIA